MIELSQFNIRSLLGNRKIECCFLDANLYRSHFKVNRLGSKQNSVSFNCPTDLETG